MWIIGCELMVRSLSHGGINDKTNTTVGYHIRYHVRYHMGFISGNVHADGKLM